MITKYPEIGICGLSCRLCPRYHIEAKVDAEGVKANLECLLDVLLSLVR